MVLRGAIDAAIFTALNVPAVTNVLTGGVHNSGPPQGTVPPYGVFSESGGSTEQTFDHRLYRRLYLVRAIVQSPWPKDAAAAYALMDAQLNNKVLTVTGGAMLRILEESPFDLREDVGGGVIYSHIGSYYVVYVDEAG